MTKKTSPALYELIRSRRQPVPPRLRRRQRQAPAAPRAQASSWGWLSAGRTVRVPVGWLLLAGTVALVIVTGAYMLGYSRGEGRAQTDFEREWLQTSEAAWRIPPPEVPASEVANPPLAAPGPDQTLSAPGPEASVGTPPAPPDPDAALVVEPGGPTADPREPGLNYFVLIHTKRDNAIKLAAFCREHGVDAFAIKAKNLSLFKVVVLPGYRRGERDDGEVRALERDIKDVARKWHLQVSARDDLAYYPEKYDPP